ncbi:MAG: hypothetical protein HUJ99_07225 [Bacteroidaceae bacterium]|nr:hypothetical protein [Bacteroidaceae bacterium]
MKHPLHRIILPLLACIVALTACHTDEKACPKPVEEFITNLYNNYVFNYGELDSIASHFSPDVLDRLRKAYADEYNEGNPAYAVWLFRTSQNGSDEQRIDSIRTDGNDLYTVFLTDGSTPCTCRMHIVMKDGQPVLTDFQTTYEFADESSDGIDVTFKEAKGYFFKTGQPVPDDALVIRSKEELEQHFGYAATLSSRPTEIDFSQQAAIAVVLPETDRATEIRIHGVTSKGQDLEVTYFVTTGESQSYTIQPMAMIIVSQERVTGQVILSEQQP